MAHPFAAIKAMNELDHLEDFNARIPSSYSSSSTTSSSSPSSSYTPSSSGASEPWNVDIIASHWDNSLNSCKRPRMERSEDIGQPPSKRCRIDSMDHKSTQVIDVPPLPIVTDPDTFFDEMTITFDANQTIDSNIHAADNLDIDFDSDHITCPPELLPPPLEEIGPVGPILRYKCPVDGCNFSTKHVYGLQRHQESHFRTADKRHLCQWPGCDKSYSRKDHLRRHERIHKGQWDYACAWCTRKFTRKDKLRDHKLRCQSRPGFVKKDKKLKGQKRKKIKKDKDVKKLKIKEEEAYDSTKLKRKKPVTNWLEQLEEIDEAAKSLLMLSSVPTPPSCANNGVSE